MARRDGRILQGITHEEFVRLAAVTDLLAWLGKRVHPLAVMEEWTFHPTRKWRFDYAVPNLKLAMEIQGHGRGAWCPVCGRSNSTGRHGQPWGMENDIEKFGEAQAMGWTILLVTHATIQNGFAQRWLDVLVTRVQEGGGAHAQPATESIARTEPDPH
jgi:hypothetical protein